MSFTYVIVALTSTACLALGANAQPDSLDVDVIIPEFMPPRLPVEVPPHLPATWVCGAVVDAITANPIVGARVDCSGGDSTSGCFTLTDSLGYFEVAVCEDPMVFTAEGYDMVRVQDWTRIEVPCEKRSRPCLELRDVMLTQSRHSPDVQR